MHVGVSDLYPHAVFVLLGLQVVYLSSCHVLPPEPTANVTTMVTQSPNKQKSNEAKCCCGMAKHPMALEDGPNAEPGPAGPNYISHNAMENVSEFWGERSEVMGYLCSMDRYQQKRTDRSTPR
ncbi:hypothetical protein D4764_06G0005790 [Takifugu flavidus]|uniref:Uncharacterized protein n=1 Tax=Takifugu flavidus TaxID=433684 RepID=A0A5C6MW85_9TELE|nr:hypothetical protein D4764_06G0005790 [Takifugu flavidus]